MSVKNDEVKKPPKYYNKKEELEIIRRYQDLISYVYLIIKKYPPDERFALVMDTKKVLFDGLQDLVCAKHERLRTDKLIHLYKAETKLNILNILVRLAKKNKYITSRNYTVWSYKITDILDMLEKWMKYCQK